MAKKTTYFWPLILFQLWDQYLNTGAAVLCFIINTTAGAILPWVHPLYKWCHKRPWARPPYIGVKPISTWTSTWAAMAPSGTVVPFWSALFYPYSLSCWSVSSLWADLCLFNWEPDIWFPAEPLPFPESPGKVLSVTSRPEKIRQIRDDYSVTTESRLFGSKRPKR